MTHLTASSSTSCSTAKYPTLKALKALCLITEKQLNQPFSWDTRYPKLHMVLKALYDEGYEYGYDELLMGLYYAEQTGRMSGEAFFHFKNMTNKEVFKNVIVPCAKALHKLNRPLTSGYAWDWIRDVYLAKIFTR